MSSIATRGVNVQEAYIWYREGKLLVNRRYQRKLVWTKAEKQKLIDSILKGYPLPLIFLAKNQESLYEIIDGMQRLNAIFSFIETDYAYKDNRYFDLKEFISAKLEEEKGSFKQKKQPLKTLSREDCAKILNYQLAVTEFSAEDEAKINEVFSRINSSGRQLSNQEKRQAGVVSGFSDLIRELSAEIRGDDSFKSLKLYNMPSISIDTKREEHGYTVSAEKTFWCHHGILSTKQLRQSDDEDMLADISASVLSEKPFPKSKEKLDELYSDGAKSDTINQKLISYGNQKLKQEIKYLFEIIDKTLKRHSQKHGAFRKIVMGEKSTASSAKAPFYTLFMAFYELVIEESKAPNNIKKIIEGLKNVNKKLEHISHHATVEQREKNIATVKGLIQKYFINQEPKQLLHGRGLAIDLENSFRRSKTENPHYEFKQGFLKLDEGRSFDKNLIQKLAQTACAMANIHPERASFIHIGVTDKPSDARKIERLDNINSEKTNGFYVVGIDREARIMKKNMDKYVDYFLSELKKTKIPKPLKSSLLKNIDTVDYRGLSVIRLKIEAQSQVSYYAGDKCFIREHSHTKEAKGPEIAQMDRIFESQKSRHK